MPIPYFKVTSYRSPQGFQIDEMEPVSAGAPEVNMPRFVGSAMVMSRDQAGHPSGPPQEVRFPIPAESLEEAFDAFEKSASEFIQSTMQQRIKEGPIIHLPGSHPRS
jgi:hypothetical protein